MTSLLYERFFGSVFRSSCKLLKVVLTAVCLFYGSPAGLLLTRAAAEQYGVKFEGSNLNPTSETDLELFLCILPDANLDCQSQPLF